jgi:peptide/nickel transport system substrate-binding protein
MLSDGVRSGSVPPLDERLPASPAVVKGRTRTGKYGGTIRRGFTGISDHWGLSKLRREGLASYNPDLSVRPNIAESWEVSEDASEWTIHLRKGLKWSEGTPFTTDDVKWYYENVLLNETLTPSPPDEWSTGSPKALAQFEIVDPFTFKIRFGQPNPLFVYDPLTQSVPTAPGFYLRQFHVDLAEDKAALERDATGAGFQSWDQYYGERQRWYLNPDLPQYGPWVSASDVPSAAPSEELFLLERNPYFFQSDGEGQQLPYVDQITHRLFRTSDELNLWIVDGQIDFQARHVDVGDYPFLRENEDRGNYRVYVGLSGDHVAVQPNHTCRDARVREFAQDRRVRIALSLAVDRARLNDIVYHGLLTPRQYSPLSMSPQAYPKQANAHIEYDPKRANQLLDQAGYGRRDREGYRLWKGVSDERLHIVVHGTALPGSSGYEAMELIAKYWADVGVEATYQPLERASYMRHVEANEIQFAFWGGDRTVLPLASSAPIFRGTMVDRPWACAWGLWKNSNGIDPNGQEPPPDHWIWSIWEVWDRIATETDPDRQNELFFQILDIWAEELPMVGFLGEQPAPIIVKDGLINYGGGTTSEEGLPVDDTTRDEHLLNTQTYFWEEPENHSL